MRRWRNAMEPYGDIPGDPRVILFMKIEHIAGQNLQDDKGFLWLAPD